MVCCSSGDEVDGRTTTSALSVTTSGSDDETTGEASPNGTDVVEELTDWFWCPGDSGGKDPSGDPTPESEDCRLPGEPWDPVPATSLKSSSGSSSGKGAVGPGRLLHCGMGGRGRLSIMGNSKRFPPSEPAIL